MRRAFLIPKAGRSSTTRSGSLPTTIRPHRTMAGRTSRGPGSTRFPIPTARASSSIRARRSGSRTATTAASPGPRPRRSPGATRPTVPTRRPDRVAAATRIKARCRRWPRMAACSSRSRMSRTNPPGSPGSSSTTSGSSSRAATVARRSRPVHVVDMEDGTRDYPINANRRQTLTGYQLRVNSRGNIVADRKRHVVPGVLGQPRRRSRQRHAGHQHERLPDGVARRHDLSGPFTVSDRNGDQWFPWVDVNRVTGMVGVLYNDRRDTARVMAHRWRGHARRLHGHVR